MDDGVEITDVNDDDLAYEVKGPLKNQDLNSLSLTAGELVSQYGWPLLLVTVLVVLLIQYVSKRRSSRRDHSSPQQAQDAAHVARNQEGMEAARRKMQEQLDANAAIFREKQKQQEEEKRKQKIDMWQSMQEGKSYKGAAKVSQPTEEPSSSTAAQKQKADKKSLRGSDYNPLTGQGGGTCAWRPGRRGPSSGG